MSTSQMFTTANGYATQVFPVQDGVTTYTFVVNGAGGGRAQPGDPGNGGGCGIVTATYTIDPTLTQSFMIVLGGQGGNSNYSGDGGGLTQVLSCSDSNGKNVDGAVNIIAGGGGGGGFGIGKNGGYGVGVPGAQGHYAGDNAPGDGTGGIKDASASGGFYANGQGGAGAVGEHSTGGSSASSNGVTASSNGGFNGGGQGGGGGGGGGGFGGGGGGGVDDYENGSGGGAGGSIAMGTLQPINNVSYSSAGLNSGDGNVLVSWTPVTYFDYLNGPVFNFTFGNTFTIYAAISNAGGGPYGFAALPIFPDGRLTFDPSGNGNIIGYFTSGSNTLTFTPQLISNSSGALQTPVNSINQITINFSNPQLNYSASDIALLGNLPVGTVVSITPSVILPFPLTLNNSKIGVYLNSNKSDINLNAVGLSLAPDTGIISGTAANAGSALDYTFYYTIDSIPFSSVPTVPITIQVVPSLDSNTGSELCCHSGSGRTINYSIDCKIVNIYNKC